jgi:hypothetical protein
LKGDHVLKKDKPEIALAKKEMTRLYGVLENLEPHTDEYKKTLQMLVGIQNLIPKQEMVLSADAILGAVVNLTGIGMVLGHERAHVITSKAFGWIGRSGKTK